MQVVSHCPLPTSSVLWQPRADRWIFTVVCKATFLLRPGLSPLAPIQEPANSIDLYPGNDERRGLLAASDLIPFKRFPEVIFTGSACAPAGAPVASLRVRLAIGSVDKVIEVVGDRFFARSGDLTPPVPFARMPISWERAAGGPGTLNPVGVRTGGASAPDERGRVVLPNLYPPGRSASSLRDVIEPVNLAPIAPGWPSRVARLPEHAHSWSSHRWSEQPLPSGFDPWFFNAAPEDQQLLGLQGGERLLLEHLHPDHPRLETTLERLVPHAIVDRGDGAASTLDLRCDALTIDGDRGRATLTWRGHIPLEHPRHAFSVFITLARPASAGEAPDADVEGTQDLGLFQAADGSALPFRAADPDAAPPLSSPDPTLAPALASVGHTAPAGLVASGKPLPFQAPGPPAAPPAEALRVVAPYAPLPAPPPLIGPLATPEAPAGPKPEEALAVSGAAAQLPPDESALAETLPEVVDVPLERYAAIQASIDRRGDGKAQCLEENDLTADEWERITQHWEDAIDADLARGKTDLLKRFDASYVAQLEEERGAVLADDYARLVVAAEQGTTEEVLEQLSLPDEAELRVERVWLERLMMDAKLAKRVREAVARRRAGA